MCLAKVYGHKNDDAEVLLADSIANIYMEADNKIRMLDIFGDETVVEGTLLNMDLERNTVRIALAQ
ncbi:MAG: CooT family nickel-binding protein [Lachnospiraceae bacterium]|nr:CooT family nickel-binding protein [Lachnospiraceae bacterium]MDY4970857.1 CooT family nickel-binding protein [Lachnospiraceae bacterium]